MKENISMANIDDRRRTSSILSISNENLLKSEAFHELISSCLSIEFYFLRKVSLSEPNENAIEIEMRWISVETVFQCLQ